MFAATVQPANLAATVAANVVLQQQQHHYLNVLHETQDAWTYQKDANTLKAYALRNLLNQNLAMANAKVYYGDLRDRLTRYALSLSFVAVGTSMCHTQLQLSALYKREVRQSSVSFCGCLSTPCRSTVDVLGCILSSLLLQT